MKCRKRIGSRMKDSSPIANAYKIYSLIVKDNAKKMTFIINDGREIGIGMDNSTHTLLRQWKDVEALDSSTIPP